MPLRADLQIVTFLALLLFAMICLGNFPKPWAVFVYNCDWASQQRTPWLEALNPTWYRFRLDGNDKVKVNNSPRDHGSRTILPVLPELIWGADFTREPIKQLNNGKALIFQSMLPTSWLWAARHPQPRLLGARHLGKRINACPLLLRGGPANLLWPVAD